MEAEACGTDANRSHKPRHVVVKPSEILCFSGCLTNLVYSVQIRRSSRPSWSSAISALGNPLFLLLL
jgi:hypothetical protein